MAALKHRNFALDFSVQGVTTLINLFSRFHCCCTAFSVFFSSRSNTWWQFHYDHNTWKSWVRMEWWRDKKRGGLVCATLLSQQSPALTLVSFLEGKVELLWLLQTDVWSQLRYGTDTRLSPTDASAPEFGGFLIKFGAFPVKLGDLADGHSLVSMRIGTNRDRTPKNLYSGDSDEEGNFSSRFWNKTGISDSDERWQRKKPISTCVWREQHNFWMPVMTGIS